jgi:hypothetical protein
VWFKHRAWIPVAWVLCLANVVAVWFAARPAEPWHASVHAFLAVLLGLGAERLRLRKQRVAAGDVVGRLRELETRLANPDPREVAQALDAIAIEIERIGEGQRFLTKLVIERAGRSPEGSSTSTSPSSETVDRD